MATQPNQRQGGFSLVELMVSVVIGLLALLFATRLVISGEANKDAAVGGSDSMQNGMLAMFSLSGDAATAGWGLNDRTVAGCNTVFSDQRGYALLGAKRDGVDITPLASVVIQSNGTAPDVISFNSGNSNAGVGSIMMTADYGGESFVVGAQRSPYGYNNGDVLVVAPQAPDRPCTVMQMAGFNPATGRDAEMLLNSGAQYRYNPAASMAQAYLKNVTFMYNLGRPDLLHFHTWSVNNGVLLLRATDLAGAEQAGISVADNIVSIKAQYGFDNRALPNWDPNPAGNGTQMVVTSTGMQTTVWSPTMMDADNDGVNGGPGDYQRISAVRIAVVARSKTVEKPARDGTCSATTVLPTVFGNSVPTGVAAVPMQVNVAVGGDPLSWKCYRYRVFETIVPILNSQYRP
ncbi:prepilin-type N-terminal cleavage/methylation domain-containing protein [Pseudoduganella sp. FT55W]|uniref:Prepilin-type N-terminal cleavage/methylation domain-containing protein n=1 Tax=Duganella rivi TaxID=2666083 RepID=A0A7X4GNW0_9BURK|nr:type II secretion system protein [Duganella rivi]MYM66943.1 prepilin-type N-terminal cleavage/methylation domain-containing protein [Duganella rivi]